MVESHLLHNDSVSYSCLDHRPPYAQLTQQLWAPRNVQPGIKIFVSFPSEENTFGQNISHESSLQATVRQRLT